MFTYRVEPQSVPVQKDALRVESEGEKEGDVKAKEAGAWLNSMYTPPPYCAWHAENERDEKATVVYRFSST